MTQINQCPRCGALAQLEGGFCPGCLLQDAFGLGDDPALTADATNYASADVSEKTPTSPKIAADGFSELTDSLGPYQVLKMLGRGGMGIVYKAWHVQLKRVVALKMISNNAAAEPEAMARFRQEAEAVARLQHPNIVQIFEVGESEGRPYLALEYVEGGSLADHLNGTPWQAHRAAKLVETLARGFHTAHEAGIVHRDIKPANILLRFDIKPSAAAKATQGGTTIEASTVRKSAEDEESVEKRSTGSQMRMESHHRSSLKDRPATDVHRRPKTNTTAPDESPRLPQSVTPKITDFGLAKVIEGSLELTQSGAFLGTPAYCAPEQATGDVHDIGPETDVYALGVMLYELLTGRPPFRGATMLDTLDHVRNREPVAPRLLNSSIRRDLETICLKCLRKSKAERYPSARTLAEDLGCYRRGEPIQARRAGNVERVVKWVRRRPTLAALLGVSFLAGIALLVLFVSGFYQLQLQEANKQLDDSNQKLSVSLKSEQKARTEAVKQRRRAEMERKRSERLLYFTDMRQAAQEWKDANLGAVNALIERHNPRKSTQKSIVCGFEWHFLNRLLHYEQHALSGHGLETVSLDFSSNGKWLATGSRDRDVRIWDASTGKQLQFIDDHPDSVSCVAFAPNKNLLATCSQQAGIIVWSLTPTSRKEFRAFIPGTPYINRVRFSPDGKHLACSHFQVMGGEQTGFLKVWRLSSRKLLRSLTLSLKDGGIIHDLAYSPNGRYLGLACQNGEVRLLNTTNYQDEALIDTGEDGFFGFAFHPKSKQIATGSKSGAVKLWELGRKKPLRTLQGNSQSVNSVVFSPNGRLIATGGEDAMIRFWHTATGQPFFAIRGHSASILALAFHPDGKRLASSSFDETVKIWDVSRTPEYYYLVDPNHDFPSGPVSHGHQITSLACAPNGKYLASAAVDGRLALWEFSSGKCLWVKAKHLGNINGLAFSHDGNHILTGGKDRTLMVWSVQNGNVVHSFGGFENAISCVACNPKVHLAAAGTIRGKIVIRDLTTHQIVFQKTVSDHRSTAEITKNEPLKWAIQTIAFSPDGTRLAAGLRFTNEDDSIPTKKNPKTEKIIARENNFIAVWNLHTEKEVTCFKEHATKITGVAFSPDGIRIVSTSEDGDVRIWEALTGKQIRKLLGHRNVAYAVTVSPDGKRILTTGSKNIRLWDVETGLETLSLSTPNPAVRAVVFHPQLRRFATGGHDQLIRVWDAGFSNTGR